MATAGDGRSPYGNGGAGGMFRKSPFRRSAQATPYDRPNSSVLRKLVEPASKLIYAGAHRLFGVLRQRLPSISLQGPPEVNQNAPQEAGKNKCTEVSDHGTDQGGHSASIFATTVMSELEQKLKQRTFTRSEYQHLSALLDSRTTDSSPVLKTGLKRRRSLLEEHFGTGRHLRLRAYRPRLNVIRELGELGGYTYAQSQSLHVVNESESKCTTTLKVGASTSTPRIRGRSAMYTLGGRPPFGLSSKGMVSDYGRAATLTSSQSRRGHGGKMSYRKSESKSASEPPAFPPPVPTKSTEMVVERKILERASPKEKEKEAVEKVDSPKHVEKKSAFQMRAPDFWEEEEEDDDDTDSTTQTGKVSSEKPKLANG